MTPHERGKEICWYDIVGYESKGLLKEFVCNKEINSLTDGMQVVIVKKGFIVCTICIIMFNIYCQSAECK